MNTHSIVLHSLPGLDEGAAVGRGPEVADVYPADKTEQESLINTELILCMFAYNGLAELHYMHSNIR